MAAEFGVLGAVEARIDGRPVDLGHARQRCVLGVLLVEAGRPVPIDQLIDRVWGEDVPQRAAGALYSYLSRLRRALADAPEVGIKRQPGGYLLTVDPQAVDLHRFRRLITPARTPESDKPAAEMYDAGARPVARRAVRRAGHAVVDLDAADVAQRAVRRRAGPQRRAAPSGPARRAAAALSAAVAEHPLDERLAEQSMLALYRGGRQADADEQYRRIRRCLADELGSDPGAACAGCTNASSPPTRPSTVPAGDGLLPSQLAAPLRCRRSCPRTCAPSPGVPRNWPLLDRLLAPPDGDDPPLPAARR